MTTPNLQLPEVPQAIEDAADEINSGFRRLDLVVQSAVLDKDLTAPPDDAVQGDRYIVPVGVTTGLWANRGRSLTMLTPDGWIFMPPRNGWRALVEDEGITYMYIDTAWQPDVSVPSSSPLTRGASWVRKGAAILLPVNAPLVRIPIAGTIVRAVILSDGGPSNCVIDVQKDTLANFPPDASDSICGPSKPTLAGAQVLVDETLSGWDTSLAAGDILRFVLESTSLFTSIYFSLDIEPS